MVRSSEIIPWPLVSKALFVYREKVNPPWIFTIISFRWSDIFIFYSWYHTNFTMSFEFFKAWFLTQIYNNKKKNKRHFLPCITTCFVKFGYIYKMTAAFLALSELGLNDAIFWNPTNMDIHILCNVNPLNLYKSLSFIIIKFVFFLLGHGWSLIKHCIPRIIG